MSSTYIKTMTEPACVKLDEQFEDWLEKSKTEMEGDKMTGFNRVVVAGNLTQKPYIKELPSGVSVADIGLAMNERYTTKAGKEIENTCFVDVVAWGKQAEACNQYLQKGSPIIVEGRLQLDQWESKTGEKRSKVRIRADHIKFLDKAMSTESNTAATEPDATTFSKN